MPALLMNEVTTMLSEFLAVTTLVVTDLDRAKGFYEQQLGLTLLEETPAGCRFGAGRGSQLTIRRGQAPPGGQTVVHFEVDDIEAVVGDLTSRGVTFEEYETPKTVNSIAQFGLARGAWFKDPAGNVLGLREGPVPAAGPRGERSQGSGRQVEP
jgi:catechol 2,3-dioxygenase-like lactoylglutathione lyase family enzyme